MSLKRLWELDLPQAAKVLLLRMAAYPYDCYASVETLAKEVRLSVRQVQRLLRVLQAAGLIVIIANAKGGRQRSRKYRVILPEENAVEELCGSPERVTSVTRKGDIRDAKRVTRPSPKLLIEKREVENESESSSNLTSGQDHAAAISVEQRSLIGAESSALPGRRNTGRPEIVDPGRRQCEGWGNKRPQKESGSKRSREEERCEGTT